MNGHDSHGILYKVFRGSSRTFMDFHGNSMGLHTTAMDFHGTDCHGSAMKMPRGAAIPCNGSV